MEAFLAFDNKSCRDTNVDHKKIRFKKAWSSSNLHGYFYREDK